MVTSTWPEHEVLPVEEHSLLQQARLRPFGANYLQGAICPALGLVAHADGSRVRLITLSSPLRSASGSCAAVIDSDSRRGGDSGPDPIPGSSRVSPQSPEPVRGVAWSPRRSSTGRDGRDVARDGVAAEEEEASCFLAVAWGHKVRLWEVSRSARGDYKTVEVITGWDGIATPHAPTMAVEGPDTGDVAAAEREGAKAAAASGTGSDSQPGVNGAKESDSRTSGVGRSGGIIDLGKRGEAGSDGVGSRTVAPISCLAFAPARGSKDASDKPGRGEEGSQKNEALPLAAWHPGGVTVLESGGRQATLAAPIAKKRTCGSWSGCGKHLAVGNAAEIRVYVPVTGTPQGGSKSLEASGGRGISEPGAEGTVPSRRGPSTIDREHERVVEEASTGQAKISGTEKGSEDVGGFRTALLVEAVMQGAPAGGDSTWPEGLGRGRLSSLSVSRDSSPVSRLTTPTSLSPGRPPDVPVSDGTTGSRPAPSNGELRENTQPAAAPPAALIGDVRAMCPAGPDAFFGTTDGGLGLGSPVGRLGLVDVSSGADKGRDRGLRREDDTGGAEEVGKPGSTAQHGVKPKPSGDSTSIPTPSAETAAGASSEPIPPATGRTTTVTAVEGSDFAAEGTGDKSSKRQGFRRVLPVESSPGGLFDSAPVDQGQELQGKQDPGSKASILSSLTLSTISTEKPGSRLSDGDRNATRATLLEAASMAGANAPQGGRSPGRGVAALLRPFLSRAGSRSPAPVSCSCSPQPDFATRDSPTPPSSPSLPEILDLRGKLGDRNAESVGAGVTHPLFRISMTSDFEVGSSTERVSAAPSHQSHLPALVSSDAVGTPRREPWLVRVVVDNHRAAAGRPDHVEGAQGGIEIEALARLPPALSSPDLVASSADGRLVAVGSHASGLVACYRVAPTQGDVVAALSAVGSTGIGSADKLGRGGYFSSEPQASLLRSRDLRGSSVHRGRTKSSRRRARAVCTLRLPAGHRAKGLAFASFEGVPGGAEDPRGNPGADVSPTAVLVLAAAPMTSSAFSAIPGSCGSIADVAALRPVSTVLLRFLLPESVDTKVVPPSVEAMLSSAKAPASTERDVVEGRRSPVLLGERLTQREAFRASEDEDPLDRDGSYRLGGSDSPVSQEGLVIRGANSTTWTYPVSPRDGNVSPFLMEYRAAADGILGSPMSGLAVGSSMHSLGGRSGDPSRKSFQGGSLGGRFQMTDRIAGDDGRSSKGRGGSRRGENTGDDLVGKSGSLASRDDGSIFVEALERMEVRMGARLDKIERMLNGVSERLGSLELAVATTRLP